MGAQSRWAAIRGMRFCEGGGDSVGVVVGLVWWWGWCGGGVGVVVRLVWWWGWCGGTGMVVVLMW